MKALTCEMCGSTNLIKKDGVFVCQSCGTQYSVEEAQKMMVEGTVDVKGTVKVDTSDELKNLYEIARRAKDGNDIERAGKYYDMILVKDPQSWEANFFTVYFKAMSCKIAYIGYEANNLYNSIEPVLKMVCANVTDPEEQENAVKELMAHYVAAAETLYEGAADYFFGINLDFIKDNDINEYVNRVLTCTNILYFFGDAVEAIFDGKYCIASVSSWVKAIEIQIKYRRGYGLSEKGKDLVKDTIDKYSNKIRKYQPDYQTPPLDLPKNTSSGGCYIATAVYGSYDCPQVWTLRRYRDYSLAKTWYGRSFIQTYYAISPTLVKWFGKTDLFQSLGRKMLDKKVKRLNEQGFENTSYNDKKW